MTPAVLPCSSCGAALPWAALAPGASLPSARCGACGAAVEAVVFPALLREPGEGTPAEALLEADQSACYYHPSKAAAVPCDGCGRFLCSLCDFPLGERHLCPACLENGTGDADRSRLERRRTLWDSVALGVAFLPMLTFWPLTFATAPAALFLAVRHWGDPRKSPIPRTAFRNGLAAFLATAQILAWGALLVTVLV